MAGRPRRLPRLSRALLAAWALRLRAAPSDVTVTEATFDSLVDDIRWLGNDRSVLLLRDSGGRMFRSVDFGQNWTRAEAPLNGTRADLMLSSPADLNTVVVFAEGTDIFASNDAGATWTKMQNDKAIRSFRFHPTEPKWALMSYRTGSCDTVDAHVTGSEDVCSHRLMITKDLGRSFQQVASHIVQFSWGGLTHQQQERIYITHHRDKASHQKTLTAWRNTVDLGYTDDFGKTMHTMLEGGNKFVLSHGYMLVARALSEASRDVSFVVSADGGRTFLNGTLPQSDTLKQMSYIVLDTSEGAIALHVNHGRGVGNVYVSDESGARYGLSLRDNVRGTSGCAFEKVMNLNGIYIANVRDSPDDSQAEASGPDGDEDEDSDTETQVDRIHQIRYLAADAGPRARKFGREGHQWWTLQPSEELSDREIAQQRRPPAAAPSSVRQRRAQADKTSGGVRSVISFDKGGAWAYLKPPEVDSRGKPVDCRAEDNCYLHLHDMTELDGFVPVYSYHNAVGIVMGSGNTGPHLTTDHEATNTYLSRDGGLTWIEAHKGAFIYEFGNRGGLLLMADWNLPTNKLIFSLDEGTSWQEVTLADKPFRVINILTEPEATSTKFVVFGASGEGLLQKGVLYYVDFTSLGHRLCRGARKELVGTPSSDYEEWRPSDGRSPDGCVLGRQHVYTRRKRDSECFNERSSDMPTFTKNCKCTEEDFECEVGFVRSVGSLECRAADAEAKASADECLPSEERRASPYRKVAGDTCEGGWRPDRAGPGCPPGARRATPQAWWASTQAVGGVLLLVAGSCLARRLPASRCVKGISGLSVGSLPRAPKLPAPVGIASQRVGRSDSGFYAAV